MNYTGQGAGTYANLFDAAPPFQIDGNFGGCAGIAEMLLQSHTRSPEGHCEIHLLPAPPKAWPTGSVRGLRARGGFEVDIAWNNGKLSGATVRSLRGDPCRVRVGNHTVRFETDAGAVYHLDGRLLHPVPKR